MKQSLKGTVFSLTSGILLGLTPLLTKTLYAAGSNPFSLVTIRMLFGIAFFALMHWVTGHSSFRFPPGMLWKLIICSVVFVLTPLLLYTSYLYMDSGLATTIQFIYPALILLGGVLFCGTTMTGMQILCCGLCLIGVACFYGGGGVLEPKGLVLVLGASVSYALYSLFLGWSGLFQLPQSLLLFWMCTFGSVVAMAATLLSGGIILPSGGESWLILSCYVVATAIASVAYQVGVYYIGAERASMLSASEPMTGMIVGVLVYQEQLTVKIILGFFCILLAGILLSRLPNNVKHCKTIKNGSECSNVSAVDS